MLDWNSGIGTTQHGRKRRMHLLETTDDWNPQLHR